MLLAGVDIEGCASAVVAVAADLAADLGESLTLLYAAQVPPTVADAEVLPGSKESAHDLVKHEAEVTLRGLAAPWVERGVDIRVDVRFGTPDDVVLEATHRMLPRLLLLGTHGRVGVARWLYGSVEESITRRCPVPVVVVPTPGTVDHLTPVHKALLVEDDG